MIAYERGRFLRLVGIFRQWQQRRFLRPRSLSHKNGGRHDIYPTRIGVAKWEMVSDPIFCVGRRKSVSAEILAQSVIAGGLIKGNQSYYDVFSAELNYMGSVKVRRGTVFSETPTDYFSGLSLTLKRVTDGLVWEKSQSIYAAASGSPMSVTLEGGVEKTIQQKNLKRALTD